MKTVDFLAALRATGVINTHDLLKRFGDKGRDVAVSYYVRDARGVMPSSSKVWSPTFKTDPQAHWTDYGSKAFSGNRAESFPLAKAWASERYGIKEWAPFGGDHVPAEVLARAREAVKGSL